jgi:FolB domain-containing protein
MDKIYIRNLELETLIGVLPKERSRRQYLTLNITLSCDLHTAGITDNLKDTIDYKTIEDKVASAIINGDFFLIERVAEVAAEICLETSGVEVAVVTVEKTGSMSYAESAIVEIERP